MGERIRDLEDALEEAHMKNSEGPHPLLCNDLKAIKYVVGHNVASEEEIPRHIHDPLDSFGSLKISDDGESRFLGPSAGSEGILLSEIPSENVEDERTRPNLPPKVYELSRMWPFTPIDLPKNDMRVMLEAQLPAWDRAIFLFELYREDVAWYAMPVDMEQITEELLPSIYNRSSIDASLPQSDNHELALLLMVFACGAAMDRSKKPKNDEGQLYYHLARVALGLQPIFESSSLATVQTLTLMTVYDMVAIRKNNLEESWKMIFLAAIIAGSIGLHRDPSRWSLNPKIMERRRRTFWEMYLVCSWQCLAGGRPPPFVKSSIDVKFPQDVCPSANSEGEPVPGYKTSKLQFLNECMTPVIDRLCADTAPLKYYEIIAFDKKVREFPDIGAIHRDKGVGHGGDIPFGLRHKMLCYKSLLRLYLHRNFFGKAISESPGNPRQPPYGMSFLTVFNMAVSVLDMFHQIRKDISGFMVHFWTMVAHTLECGFIVGSVAARCPRTYFAEQAIKSLETAIELFQGIDHPISENGLPVLLRLRDKAQQAQHAACIVLSSTTPASSNESEPGKDELDELTILRGSSRLVAQPSGKRSVSSHSDLPTVTVPSISFVDGATTQADMFYNGFFTEPSTQSHLQTVGPDPSLQQHQARSSSWQDLDSLNWDDILNQAGDPRLQPVDLATSIGVGDRAFANLLKDAFLDPLSQLPQSWNFGGSQFMF